MEEDLKIEIAKISENLKVVNKRLDVIEENQSEIKDLAISTKLLAQTVAMQQKDIDQINKNLESIKEKPMKWIDLMKSTIISVFFGSVTAAIISLLAFK